MLEFSMSLFTGNLARWHRISTGLGASVWVGISLAWLRLSALEVVLLFVLLVLTPLALPLLLPWQEGRAGGRATRLVYLLQPVAALLGGVAFLFDPGLLAGAYAAVWAGFTGLLALCGLLQLREHAHSLSALSLAAALLYLPVGGAWMVAGALGFALPGLGVQIALLTALHFQVIPLAALSITGLSGQVLVTLPVAQRGINWTLYRIAACGVLFDPLLVAAGQGAARIGGLPALDTVPAGLLALSLILLAFLSQRFVVPATVSQLARVLLAVSYLTIVATMLIAGVYVLGVATGAWTITQAQMVALHGLANALLFGGCGLSGWRVRRGQHTQGGGESCG